MWGAPAQLLRVAGLRVKPGHDTIFQSIWIPDSIRSSLTLQDIFKGTPPMMDEPFLRQLAVGEQIMCAAFPTPAFCPGQLENGHDDPPEALIFCSGSRKLAGEAAGQVTVVVCPPFTSLHALGETSCPLPVLNWEAKMFPEPRIPPRPAKSPLPFWRTPDVSG